MYIVLVEEDRLIELYDAEPAGIVEQNDDEIGRSAGLRAGQQG